MPEQSPRGIRSFVMRAGRITAAQERALCELWPRYGVEFTPGPLDLDALFERRAARTLEVGFGNGANLLALAGSHPERDYLGIEVHRPGVGRLLLGIEAQALRNVRVSAHDAVEVLQEQIAPASIDEILILFPDPWPKKRHHKRRLLQAPFIALLAGALRRGGIVRLATDWVPYAHEMLAALAAEPRLRNLAPDGAFLAQPTGRIGTRFESRGRKLGHEVRDLAFERV